jgi:hypothetical protein
MFVYAWTEDGESTGRRENEASCRQPRASGENRETRENQRGLLAVWPWPSIYRARQQMFVRMWAAATAVALSKIERD